MESVFQVGRDILEVMVGDDRMEIGVKQISMKEHVGREEEFDGKDAEVVD